MFFLYFSELEEKVQFHQKENAKLENANKSMFHSYTYSCTQLILFKKSLRELFSNLSAQL